MPFKNAWKLGRENKQQSSEPSSASHLLEASILVPHI